MHRPGRFVDPVSGPRRPAPVVEAPGDDVEIGRAQMRMGRIHLALVGLDERTPGTRLFTDPQHLELIPVAALKSTLLHRSAPGAASNASNTCLAFAIPSPSFAPRFG